MKQQMTAVIFGVIIIVVGLVLESTVLSTAATAGSDANAPSFTGARNLNDLVPLVYNAAIVIIGVGLIGVGTAGFAGRGPLR
jgi:xanthine/uracil permease